MFWPLKKNLTACELFQRTVQEEMKKRYVEDPIFLLDFKAREQAVCSRLWTVNVRETERGR